MTFGDAGDAAAPAAPGRRPAPWREHAGWLALLAALAAWGGWFIFRTSFVLAGRRVFCLFDDAMISMTYARNLVEGYGLNWARQGAPVEGFTHPLWIVLMVPVNLLPIPLDRRSLVVQLASLALLLLHLALVRRLVQRHFTRPGARHWAPACVLTAFYYPLDYWALMGMETGLQAVLTTASVLLALDTVHGGRDRRFALLLIGTLAVLLRLDMALVVALTQVYVLAGGGLGRLERLGRPGRLERPERPERPERRGWRGSLAGAAVLAAAAGGYALFRWRYFHALLPNTYYLKLGGIPLAVRVLRGGSVMLDMLRAHWLLLAAAAVGAGAQVAGAPGGDAGDGDGRDWASRLTLPAAVFGACCLYSVYVGGDVWEGAIRANRFVAFAMPQVFILLNALANQALAAARRRHFAGAGAADGGAAGRGAAGRGELPAGEAALRGAPPPAAGRGASCRSPLALRCSLLAATAAALLAANGLWPVGTAQEAWRVFMVVERPLHVAYHQVLLGKVRALQRIASPAAAVAVVWAGIPAYFSDFRMIDLLGYNDGFIARQPPAASLDEDNFQIFLPGHMKWDTGYVLDHERPDVLLQLWGIPERRAGPLLRAHGYRRVDDAWFLRSSPSLHLPPPAAGATAAAVGAAAEAAPPGDAGL